MMNFVLKNGGRIVHVLKGRSNAYIIQTPSEILLVDTGVALQRKKLMRNLKRIHIDHIDQLLLTHAHFDHCQNAFFLKEQFNCKICCHVKSEKWIQKGCTPLPAGILFFSKWIAKLGDAMGSKINHFRPFGIDRVIDVGAEHYSVADCIDVIPTPGHSGDSVSFIVNNEVALVGDALFGVLKNSVLPPFADDYRQMLESWNKLIKTPCSVFFPGHGKPIGRNLLQSQIKKYT